MKPSRRHLLIAALATAIATSLGCSDDGTTPPPAPKPPEPDLSRREDVLNDIEYAYRSIKSGGIQKYDNLLDADFIFFYTDGDVAGGIPVQWGRAEEIKTTSGLFDNATKIDLDIDWEKLVPSGWVESTVNGETWYSLTANYNFTIVIGADTYLSNAGARATFTVRNAGTEAAPRWQLVEFHDLGAPQRFSSVRAANSTDQSTWGEMKALYR